MGSRATGYPSAASNLAEVALCDPVTGLPYVANPGPTSSTLNISAATLVKATAGRLGRINVITAGSTVGSVNDVASIGAAAAANQIAAIPNTVGVTAFDWPCAAGIVITPGTGQVVSVSWL